VTDGEDVRLVACNAGAAHASLEHLCVFVQAIGAKEPEGSVMYISELDAEAQVRDLKKPFFSQPGWSCDRWWLGVGSRAMAVLMQYESCRC
jgi:hypothetical protein